MNLHEYQAKAILNDFGVTIQRGIVATTPEEAVDAAKKLTEETGTGWHVIKAQVHAGGRGKGGGVKLVKNLQEVKDVAGEILGMTLVTPQTSEEGKKVHQIMVTEDVYYPGENEPEEYYMSVLLNRNTARTIIMYSPEGGMDIESVAEKTPEKVFTEEIDPATGLLPFQARRIAFNLGLSGKAFKEMVKFVGNLYNAYEKSDSTLFEINPVLKASDDKILAVDAKVTLDDSALYRHKDYAELRDEREENPIEVEAAKAGLNYVDLDGNVGCMVNGAGLAMSTMDLIKQAGGNPANFLDVGGTADAERVEEAFRLILKDDNVEAILINIFGGIVRCDRVAQGIIDAYKNMGDQIKVPIIVRLQGTNAEEAKKMIDGSGLNVESAITFQEAADKVQKVLS
ncbi:MAG TPA: ADP-forming succinate--CoA ligase subunit beta [Flavobacteriaceae bacterium]|nr:ADP-forming succinate--CoA ligase subunit beta [Flavobacteriaceae bacterium]